MTVNTDSDIRISTIAAAIGDSGRSRMLLSLMDGGTRTSTELAVIAGVSPSTASVHLSRLVTERLLKVASHGRHHYYSLAGADVACALEKLAIVAGVSGNTADTKIPFRLRAARSCYDHMAGVLGVGLHDRFLTLRWIDSAQGREYDLTAAGTKALELLGLDLKAFKLLRRRFAYSCQDWSERRPHIGGALGAALLSIALKKKWVTRDLDSRSLCVTNHGKRELLSRFDLQI